jgi:hypothetical protein
VRTSRFRQYRMRQSPASRGASLRDRYWAIQAPAVQVLIMMRGP